MLKKGSFIVMMTLALLLTAIQPALAADADIVISEVMFNSACESNDSTGVCGSGSNSEVQFEWVEIYNKGTTSVDLTGWQICDETDTCRSLSGIILAGEYWVIAHNNDTPNYDLQDEFDNYGATVDVAKTIFLNDSIGSLGLAQGGDAVYLRTDESSCGPGSDLPCVSDCISWDGTNTCASIVDDTSLAYLPGADGSDDTSLTSNEGDGQSVVNIQGTWYQSGPGTNQDNQASPYTSNIAEGGSPTTVTFTALRVSSDNLLVAAVPICILTITLTIILLRRR